VSRLQVVERHTRVLQDLSTRRFLRLFTMSSPALRPRLHRHSSAHDTHQCCLHYEQQTQHGSSLTMSTEQIHGAAFNASKTAHNATQPTDPSSFSDMSWFTSAANSIGSSWNTCAVQPSTDELCRRLIAMRQCPRTSKWLTHPMTAGIFARHNNDARLHGVPRPQRNCPLQAGGYAVKRPSIALYNLQNTAWVTRRMYNRRGRLAESASTAR